MAYVHDVSREELFHLCRREDFLPELIYEEDGSSFPIVIYTLLVAFLTLNFFFCLRALSSCCYYQSKRQSQQQQQRRKTRLHRRDNGNG